MAAVAPITEHELQIRGEYQYCMLGKLVAADDTRMDTMRIDEGEGPLAWTTTACNALNP